MSKLKLVRSIIKDRLELERIVRDTVDHQIKREQSIAARDAALLVLNEKHNPGIDALGEIIDANILLLEQWADCHPEEFGAARSILVNGHRLGFRLGQPSASPAGKLTWKAIIATLKKWLHADNAGIADPEVLASATHHLDLARKYLRQKWEANKEAMLETGRIDKPEAAAELSEIGVEITQSEEFYLEPAREGQPDTRLSGATREAA
jgi:hypothetical protein